MKFFVFLLIFVLIPFQLVIGQHAIEDFPKPVNGYISNIDRILTDQEADFLNKSVLAFEKETSIEIAIVLVETVGGTTPRLYGKRLFNKWGIGKKDKNNGLMILFSKGDRRIEFIPGHGIKDIMDQSNSVRIQQKYMLPSFKTGYYYRGLQVGLEEVQSYLKNYSNFGFIGAYFFSLHPILQGYLTLAFLISLLAFLYVTYVIFVSKTDPFKKHQQINFFASYILMVLFLLPYLFVGIYTMLLQGRLRRTPRRGVKTGKLLRLLREDEENVHLSKIQITEESIKSIEYDVWASEGDEEILILNYPQSSKFKKCHKCSAKAYAFSHKKVTKVATYSSSGRGVKIFTCRHCQHVKKVGYHIPQKVEASTYEYESSSSSGSYSSSSYSSSSSSSSSFGGGYSSGGGGGSSW